MPPLTNSRQEIYTQNWFSGKTKEESAIIAGYAPKWARSHASHLSTNHNILARYNELQQKAESDTVMNRQEMLETHTEIARGRIGNLLDENQRIKQGANLTNASIQEVDTTDIKIGKGENSKLARVTKIKLHDPVRSMQEIAKLQGHYPKEEQPILNIGDLKVLIVREKPKEIEDVTEQEEE